ncbi:MAG TPA: hypothetical protein VNN19_12465 [bacterium]|nr:hypothetical protein [bacterium]
MDILTPGAVARYRRAVVGAHRVRTKAQALRFVTQLGFCYAFTPGPGELPALFDVLATRSVDRMWSWVWRWKDELATERRLFYGRLVRGKPTFVSLRYLPAFFALTGNVGEPDDYLQAYREGRLSRLAKELYEVLRAEGRSSTWTLRRRFVGPSADAAAFHRALRMLQERCLIAKVGEQDDGSFAFIWDTFDRWLPDVVRRAAALSAEQAAAALLERYVRTLGAVSLRAARALFAWPPATFEAARQALAGRVIETTLQGEPALAHPAVLALAPRRRPRR